MKWGGAGLTVSNSIAGIGPSIFPCTGNGSTSSSRKRIGGCRTLFPPAPLDPVPLCEIRLFGAIVVEYFKLKITLERNGIDKKETNV